MSIIVELFGIPRQRAGVAKTEAAGTRLDEVVADLAERFPRLAEECFAGRGLKPGTLANLQRLPMLRRSLLVSTQIE